MDLEIEITDIKAEARSTRRDVDELRHTIFGNGSKGMKAAVQDLTTETKNLSEAVKELSSESKASRERAADISMTWKLLIASAFVIPIGAIIIERITR